MFAFSCCLWFPFKYIPKFPTLSLKSVPSPIIFPAWICQQSLVYSLQLYSPSRKQANSFMMDRGKYANLTIFTIALCHRTSNSWERKLFVYFDLLFPLHSSYFVVGVLTVIALSLCSLVAGMNLLCSVFLWPEACCPQGRGLAGRLRHPGPFLVFCLLTTNADLQL